MLTQSSSSRVVESVFDPVYGVTNVSSPEMEISLVGVSVGFDLAGFLALVV